MNPFTRLQDSSFSTGLFLANKRGVLASTDQTNVSLHVTGDASIDGKLHLNELLANEYTEVSDIRKKKNVQNLELQRSIDVVSKLEPISFNYKDNNKHNYGYSAQEIEKLDPKLIKKLDDGTYTMHYNKLNIHIHNVLKHLLNKENSKNQ